MDQREFFPKHNVVVSIDPTALGSEAYRHILEFLSRPRIFHVLTHLPPLMIEYIREFWSTASFDCEPNPPVIRARVNNVDITFSRLFLCTVLQLGSNELENGPTKFPYEMRAGAFSRMGYSRDLTKA